MLMQTRLQRPVEPNESGALSMLSATQVRRLLPSLIANPDKRNGAIKVLVQNNM